MMDDVSSSPCETAEDTFLPFPRLPTELRLLIWGLNLPHRDFGASHPSYHHRNPQATLLRPPLLSIVCRESRHVALASGHFVPLPDRALAKLPNVGVVGERLPRRRNQKKRMAWVDHDIRVLYLRALKLTFREYWFSRRVDAIALLPRDISTRYVDWFHQAINQGTIPRTKVVYLVISAIVYDEKDNYDYAFGNSRSMAQHETVAGKAASPGEYKEKTSRKGRSHLYDESKISTMDLADSRLPSFLDAAFKAAKARDRAGMVHQTASCFLQYIRQQWDSARLRSIRHAWASGTSDSSAPTKDQEAFPGDNIESQSAFPIAQSPSTIPDVVPELRPAVMFGRAREALLYTGGWPGSTSGTMLTVHSFNTFDPPPPLSVDIDIDFDSLAPSTVFDCRETCGFAFGAAS